MTTFHSYPAAFQHIVDSMASLYAKKNADYGNSFADTWEKLGAVSGVTRISDKFNRLCNLLTSKNEQQVKDESIEDITLGLSPTTISRFPSGMRMARERFWKSHGLPEVRCSC